MIPQVGETTQKSKILIELRDPLGIDDPKLKKLELNSFVYLEIEGDTAKESAKLSWSLIRNNNRVWILKDDKLEIREVGIIHKGSDSVLVSGLEDGEKIVTTNLGNPANGMNIVQKQEKATK